MKKHIVIVTLLSLAFFLFLLLYPLPSGLARSPSTAIVSRDGELLRIFCAEDGRWRMRCRLKEVSPFLVKAVVAYEDRWFYWHFGINPFSIIRAAITNIKHRRIICGGSTITMQIARMTEPKKRTFVSKAIECFRAEQLELRYSKSELLELYFNLAPYGGNLEGIASASYFYFGKSPSALSSAEAVFLVGLPNSPERLRPDRNPKAALCNQKRVAERLLKSGFIKKDKYSKILFAQPLENKKNIPFIAPHLGDLVRRKFGNKPLIRTTIDFDMQKLCEKTLAEHLSPLLAEGISNGAIVVIENKTRKVRAMVGSVNFFDKARAGEVNGALAGRSPGSTLKPFIYTIALDEGLLSPKSLLFDIPVDYSGYIPENYDGKYHGAVTFEDALKESLNVPAVNLCAKIKGRLYCFLKDGGVTTLNKPEELYGLPLILGGCEVSLLELTNLYSTLANFGLYQKYLLLEDEEMGEKKRLLSPESTYIISEILSEVRRPDLPSCWEFSLNLPKVAWKTGTSYGHKDAWAIGYNPDWTIGVWIGNFSGREAEGLVGAEVAAPLLFTLFNSIGGGKGEWFEKPERVGIRQVCTLSGQPPSQDCPKTKEELFIYGLSSSATCQIHKVFDIEDKRGYRLCPYCKDTRSYHKELFVEWYPKISTWMEREGYPIVKIPSHNPDCPNLIAKKPPIITSPSVNCEYYLRDWVDKAHQKIAFDASVSSDVKKLYWFINGEFFASISPKEKLFYPPVAGRHIIKCMDDRGLSTEVTLRVY